MRTIKIIKLSPKVQTPKFETTYSSGADIRTTIPEPILIEPGETVAVPTGLKMQPPEGYGIYLFPRSGLAYKLNINLGNCVGVIDRDYKDEVKVLLHNNNAHKVVKIMPEERVAQIVVLPVTQLSFTEVTELDQLANDNRTGGFGSSGRY